MTVRTVPGPRTYPGWMEAAVGLEGQATTPEAFIARPFTQQARNRELALRIGGLVWGCRDSDGYIWTLEGIKGLHSIGVSAESDKYLWRDGAWIAPGFVGGKHLEVTCHVIAPADADSEGLHARLAVVGQTLPVRGPAPIVVWEYGRAWHLQGQVVDEIDVTRVGAFVYSIQFNVFVPDPVLVAADWERAAPAWTTRTLTAIRTESGFVLPTVLPHHIPEGDSEDTRALFNVFGASAAKVILRVDGPLDRAVISDEAGWEVEINARIEGGQTLTIDPALMSVDIGGASRRAWINGWPILKPGLHAITWETQGATADTRLHIDYVETTI